LAGKIPREFIEDIVARSDIVDVIDSRVRLKKAGRNYQACCPFHNEKTPSFSVSPEKQFYYCFGCGAKGNVITFLMEHDRLEFVEAVEELASLQGLRVPRESSSSYSEPAQNKQQLTAAYGIMQQAANFFSSQLKTHKNRDAVVAYLKGRGLSGEIVKYWGIGYAPDAWDGLMKHFDNSSTNQLLSLKLINENENKRRYDFFRHRIMFPILDRRGRVIAFGGRSIDDNGPKYLNSPETNLFKKSNELYGLYQARKENRQLDRLLVVEGYMDVVALSQFGISYAVAALGTATTNEHIQIMFKATSEVICCYDGDKAGRTAAWRALENALSSLRDGVVMRFLFLPDGEDPDTMVRKEGKENFEKRLDEALPLSQFFFNTMLERHSIASIESKAALKAEAQPLIANIKGENQRQMMMAELSKLCGEADAFKIESDKKKARNVTAQKENKFGKEKVKLSPLRHMIRLLMEDPSIASKFDKIQPRNLQSLEIPGLAFLVEFHDYCYQHPQTTTALLLEVYRDHPYGGHIFKLLEHPSDMIKDIEQEYVDCFKALLKQYLNQRLSELEVIESSTGLTDAQQQELQLLMSKKGAM